MAFRMLVRVAADTLLPRSAASGSFAPAVALSRTQANLFGTDVSATSGVPEGALAKKVTIYAPARTAGQQGRGKTIEGASHPWSLSFPKGAKWENPLMGWTSTADAHENLARAANGLNFTTKEEAIAYCEKMGYAYEVKEPLMRSTNRTPRFATYGDNFSTRQRGIPTGGLRSEIAK